MEFYERSKFSFKFQSNLEREVVKTLGAAAMIKPVLDNMRKLLDLRKKLAE